MKRRDFLKGLAATAAVAAPLGTTANPIKPGDKLPEEPKLDERKAFVEDLYVDPPLGSHTQDRGLPGFHGLSYRGHDRTRVVYKRWNGKTWEPT